MGVDSQQVPALRKIGAIEVPESEKPIEGSPVGFLGVVGGYNDVIVAAHQPEGQTAPESDELGAAVALIGLLWRFPSYRCALP